MPPSQGLTLYEPATPTRLGGYANAIETQPTATLTGTGLAVGAVWGAMAGWLASKAGGSNASGKWTVAGAIVGGALGAAAGHRQGVELATWLRQY